MLTDPGRGVKPPSARAGERGTYVACGPHAAFAFVEARPDAVDRVLVARDAAPATLQRLAARGVRPLQSDPATLERLAGSIPHQGLIAVGEPPAPLPLASVLRDKPQLVLAVDGVTDPRNVGALVRSCDAAGVGAIVVPTDRAPRLSPALVKAAAGAVEWVPFVRVTNVARTLESLAGAGYWVVGLDGDASVGLYDRGAFPGLPCVVVVGSEGKGMRPLVARGCHRLLRIPMAGRAESLNVSVAAAVALFELRRLADSAAFALP
jgi:23S rRNA (guanosine2251-2'-O)-methyltransferase